ncbi:hypothetical protein RRF57_005463 [Xylaria bambusicola]|uniref:Uncharacterized protein n=1 Tax=Xylaria bambusicola TaxID=326684 RepID=A0AAN7UY39_9PEZI
MASIPLSVARNVDVDEVSFMQIGEHVLTLSELVVIEYPHSQSPVTKPKRSGKTAKTQEEATEACTDGRSLMVLAVAHVLLTGYARVFRTAASDEDGICRDQKRAVGARARDRGQSERKRGNTENGVSVQVIDWSHVNTEHKDTRRTQTKPSLN